MLDDLDREAIGLDSSRHRRSVEQRGELGILLDGRHV
jgi:hypothetical protein